MWLQHESAELLAATAAAVAVQLNFFLPKTIHYNGRWRKCLRTRDMVPYENGLCFNI